MLNKDGIRELAYVVAVDAVEPIAGRDRVECARVGGWTCMVPKGAFKAGDLGIYFEIDSQVPLDNPIFEFCAKYKGHIKTQKFKTPDGQFWSQGLLMAPADFGWSFSDGKIYTEKGEVFEDGTFLTQRLNVTYYEEEDNKRKAKVNPDAKVNAALGRHPRIAKKFGKFIKKNKVARAIFLFFFGRKKDVKSWPSWVVKTDEERVQNMPWILNSKEPWIVTEKIDGTSTTFTMKRGKFGKYEFYVCSRNVVFDKPDKSCYYDTNVYLEMAEKYDVENVLKKILDENKDFEWVTLQGETYGEGIQKRDYSLLGHDFVGFNFITSKDGRWNSKQAAAFVGQYGIPWVPILDNNFILPDTVEELLAIATDRSVVDGDMREGIVLRSQDGSQSFKAVSNEFLMKYHNG